MSSKRLNSIRKLIEKPEITYLEIGIENANTFRHVSAKRKIGVDPFPLCRPPLRAIGSLIARVTSDNFFIGNKETFDLVFIDGLHTYEQTYRDLLNSFLKGSKEVLILVDDVIPSDKYAAKRSQLECQVLKQENGIDNNFWMGDVFKILPLLSTFHTEISWVTIVEKDENPQLLLWRSPLASHTIIKDWSEEFTEIEGRYEYEELFKNGVPDYFRSKTFESALEIVKNEFF